MSASSRAALILISTLNSIYNTCQDSLLATPLIIDLCIIAELLTRVTYRENESDEFQKVRCANAQASQHHMLTSPFLYPTHQLYSVLGLLSYLLKAPLTKPGVDPINSLGRQRGALESFMKACLGLQPGSDLLNFTQIATASA